MNNPIKLTVIVLIPLIALMFVACASVQKSAAPVSDNELGLRKGTLMNEEVLVPESRMELKDAGESQVMERSFDSAPPYISHNINEFIPITKNDNMCIECHLPEVAADMNATPVSDLHLKDGELRGANYNCTMCHVAPTNAKLLVKNNF